jgi:hypothetical protein
METLAWVVPMVTQEGKEETDTAAAASTLFFIKVLLVFTVKLLFKIEFKHTVFHPEEKEFIPARHPHKKNTKLIMGKIFLVKQLNSS